MPICLCFTCVNVVLGNTTSLEHVGTKLVLVQLFQSGDVEACCHLTVHAAEHQWQVQL